MIGSLLDGKETGTSWNTVKKVKGLEPNHTSIGKDFCFTWLHSVVYKRHKIAAILWHLISELCWCGMRSMLTNSWEAWTRLRIYTERVSCLEIHISTKQPQGGSHSDVNKGEWEPLSISFHRFVTLPAGDRDRIGPGWIAKDWAAHGAFFSWPSDPWDAKNYPLVN